MKRMLLNALVALGLVGGLLSPCWAAEPQEISAPELKQMMDSGSVVVVFPLSRIEFNNMHIKGSVHIPASKLLSQLPADKTTKVAFYCLGRR